MNEYEIFLFIAWGISVFILIGVVEHLNDKIMKLEDKIEKLHMLRDMLDGKLERIENDIYALMDRTRKEGKK